MHRIPNGGLLAGLGITALFAGWAFAAIPAGERDASGPSQGDIVKKVWTNDDLHALENSPLSFDSDVASTSPRAPAQSAPKAKSLLPKTEDPAWYRVQLAPLRAEVAEIEARQRQIRAELASHRGGTKGLNLLEDPEGITPESAIAVLEQRRKAVLKKIDALEDLAHHNGILPGELRREPAPGDYAISDYEQYALDSAPLPAPPRTEQEWRARFAELYTKLAHAQRELEVLKQEYAIAFVQYYPDPSKTLKEGYTFREVNQLRARIAEKKAEVASLEQDISDLEDDLRHAGGPPGWSR